MPLLGLRLLLETSNVYSLKNGMTPLQQAAFRGHRDVCRYLLEHGADVNSNKHDNGYSALMFAALSGDTDVTRMLLEAGADVLHTNSVNRNASQMAAFVSNHEVVALINNFLPKTELEYYTKPMGVANTVRLSSDLVQPLHSLLLLSNLHPVKVLHYLSSNICLVMQATAVCRVLDDLIKRHMAPHDTHEGLALKLHYFACVLRQSDKSASTAAASGDNSSGKVATVLAAQIKKLSKGRDSDGFLENAEIFVRSTLKSFPHPESSLFQQAVKRLAVITLGDSPTAVQVLDSLINGMRVPRENTHECALCTNPSAEKRCSQCRSVWYCCGSCQKLHWPTHKRHCHPSVSQTLTNHQLEKDLAATTISEGTGQ